MEGEASAAWPDRVLPSQAPYNVEDILFKKGDDRGEGIVVGWHIEVKGTPKEMAGAVGEVKLERRSSLRSADIVYQSVHLVTRPPWL